MIIARRYNGPPESANGGYAAGLVASHVDGHEHGAQVRLLRPPPLDIELSVRIDDVARVYAGEELIASGQRARVEGVVAPVSLADAAVAARTYRGFRSHPFPTCFVCGPERGDGLRIFPGRLPDGRTAAPFTVPADVSPEMVWASLDCPGGWAVPLEDRRYVLGEVAARVDAVPVPGDECVVVGQLVEDVGRKGFVRSTLYAPDGRVLATSRATWLSLDLG